MLSLYNILHVDSESSQDQIEKNYMALYRECKFDNQSLIKINNAYSILKDSYKRSFYDRFGDDSLWILQDTNLSVFATRFFTTKNTFFIILSCYLAVSNFCLYGLISFFNKSHPIFNIIFFLIAPLCLIPVNLDILPILHKKDANISSFFTFVLVFLLNNCNLAMAYFEKYNWFFLILELFLLYFICYKAHKTKIGIFKILFFFLSKTAFVFLLCYVNASLKMYVYLLPIALCMTLSVFKYFLGPIAALLVLPNSVGLFLINYTSYFKTGLCIISIYSILSLCLISFSIVEIISFAFKKLHHRLMIPEKSEFYV